MAKKPEIRKIVTSVEEIRFEGFRELDQPIHKCVAAAVIQNPFAGVYIEDLSELSEYGEYLGAYLADIAVKALNGASVHSYGKGAIVGLNGELEHGGAILHPSLGKPMREAVRYRVGGSIPRPRGKAFASPAFCGAPIGAI